MATVSYEDRGTPIDKIPSSVFSILRLEPQVKCDASRVRSQMVPPDRLKQITEELSPHHCTSERAKLDVGPIAAGGQVMCTPKPVSTCPRLRDRMDCPAVTFSHNSLQSISSIFLEGSVSNRQCPVPEAKNSPGAGS